MSRRHMTLAELSREFGIAEPDLLTAFISIDVKPKRDSFFANNIGKRHWRVGIEYRPFVKALSEGKSPEEARKEIAETTARLEQRTVAK